MTVEDLLNLLLVGSDNAAARALARVSPYGSDGFVDRMNEKAQELGLTATHYADPSGLLADNVSSAYDMAQLIAYAAADERIGARDAQDVVHDLRGGKRTITANSTNQLVKTGDIDVLGGKTGFISRSGYCLASLLRLPQTGQQVAVVVLGAKSNASRFWETRHLFNWLSSRTKALVGSGGRAEHSRSSSPEPSLVGSQPLHHRRVERQRRHRIVEGQQRAARGLRVQHLQIALALHASRHAVDPIGRGKRPHVGRVVVAAERRSPGRTASGCGSDRRAAPARRRGRDARRSRARPHRPGSVPRRQCSRSTRRVRTSAVRIRNGFSAHCSTSGHIGSGSSARVVAGWRERLLVPHPRPLGEAAVAAGAVQPRHRALIDDVEPPQARR